MSAGFRLIENARLDARNTFGVPAVVQAQIADCIAANPECGRSLSTVNALVLECNDGYLSDIQRMAVTAEHYRSAVAAASIDVAQGAVGAGRGRLDCRTE